MLGRVLCRAWHHISTVHLPNSNRPPPPTLSFTPNGFVVIPRVSELTPNEVKVNFKNPQPFELQPWTSSIRLKTTHKPEPAVSKATAKKLATSRRKLDSVVYPIHGLSVGDALAKLQTSIRKPAGFVKQLLKSAVINATHTKGMDIERLYIHKLHMGSNKGIKGLRYHAKGRAGLMRRPRVQLTVELAEKTVEQYGSDLILGKFSPAQAKQIRENLLVADADLTKIQKGAGLLTAKGRQQTKLMFERKLYKAIKTSSLHPIRVREKLLEEHVQDFAEKYWKVKRETSNAALSERREVFEQNLKRK